MDVDYMNEQALESFDRAAEAGPIEDERDDRELGLPTMGDHEDEARREAAYGPAA